MVWYLSFAHFLRGWGEGTKILKWDGAKYFIFYCFLLLSLLINVAVMTYPVAIIQYLDAVIDTSVADMIDIICQS